MYLDEEREKQKEIEYEYNESQGLLLHSDIVPRNRE